MPKILSLLAVSLLSLVLYSLDDLHGRALVLEQKQRHLDMTERLHFCGTLPDGTGFIIVQEQDEETKDLVERYAHVVRTGEVPEGSPKMTSWSDENGVTHQVILAHDPAWTEHEWCKRFDNAVALLQEAFPCE